MKLHHSSEDFSASTTRKLKSVVTATGVQVEFIGHKSKDDISKISVFQNLPLLETPQGTIFSSSSIVRYLAASSKNELYGGENLHLRALIDQWLDFNTTQFQPTARAVLAIKNGVKVDLGKVMEDVNKFLAAVQKHLNGNKFLVGESLSIADLSLAASVSVIFSIMFGEGQRKKYQNTCAWYDSIVAANPEVGPAQLPKEADQAFKGGKKGKKQEPKKKEEKKQQKKEEEDELFGDDDDATPAAKPVVKAQPKKQKKKAVAKSIIVFDVKVYEQQEDLNALFNKIKSLEIDGLVWNSEPKIIPVAFGMNKLQVGCVVEDEKVSVDDIYEKIEDWEEVQSTDTVSFQKL